jgi:hypothetical protein
VSDVATQSYILGLSDQEVNALNIEAGEARRLLDDPSLWAVLRQIEQAAVYSALNDDDAATREVRRHEAAALQRIRQNLHDRVQTALLVAHVRAAGKQFE